MGRGHDFDPYCYDDDDFGDDYDFSDENTVALRREVERQRQRRIAEITTLAIQKFFNDFPNFSEFFIEHINEIDTDRLCNTVWRVITQEQFLTLLDRGIKICRPYAECPKWVVSLFKECLVDDSTPQIWFDQLSDSLLKGASNMELNAVKEIFLFCLNKRRDMAPYFSKLVTYAFRCTFTGMVFNSILKISTSLDNLRENLDVLLPDKMRFEWDDHLEKYLQIEQLNCVAETPIFKDKELATKMVHPKLSDGDRSKKSYRDSKQKHTKHKKGDNGNHLTYKTKYNQTKAYIDDY